MTAWLSGKALVLTRDVAVCLVCLVLRLVTIFVLSRSTRLVQYTSLESVV